MGGELSTYAVIFYDTPGMQGITWPMNPGEYPDVTALGIGDDAIVSARVQNHSTVILYENKNFGGASKTLTDPEYPDLSLVTDGTKNWSHRVSSFKVIAGPAVSPSGNGSADAGVGAAIAGTVNNAGIVAPAPVAIGPPVPLTQQQIVDCCSSVGMTSAGSSGYSCGSYIPGTSTCLGELQKYCSAAGSSTAFCQSWCAANTGMCPATSPVPIAPTPDVAPGAVPAVDLTPPAATTNTPAVAPSPSLSAAPAVSINTSWSVSTSALWLILFFVVLVAAGVAAWYYWRHRKGSLSSAKDLRQKI